MSHEPTNRGALYDAKRPRSILAGPYGHPFHAMLITIPIGAWTASVAFDILALLTRDSGFSFGAVWLVAIGTLGGIAAATVGFLDYSQIARATRARMIANIHMIFNLSAITLFGVSYFLRIGEGTREFSTAGFVLSIIGILGVAVSGFLGGELAYRFGVRVADEETQRTHFA